MQWAQVVGAGEQWTGWQVHFHYMSFMQELLKCLCMLRFSISLTGSSKYITAKAGRLRYKFVLALAELNTWSFCQYFVEQTEHRVEIFLHLLILSFTEPCFLFLMFFYALPVTLHLPRIWRRQEEYEGSFLGRGSQAPNRLLHLNVYPLILNLFF